MTKLFHEPLLRGDSIIDIDKFGSLIAGVHLDPDKAYSNFPLLLQNFIHTQDEKFWNDICQKIDYIYEGIFVSLNFLNQETNFMCQVKDALSNNKKLLFKPNLMSPDSISGSDQGAGASYTLATKWPFVAAIMRWFHDTGNINYSQMALVEGCVDYLTILCNKMYGSKLNVTITNEGLIEGRVPGKTQNFDGGWGFYYVRKYLSSHRLADESDNPMNGYEESINGIYLAPGQAKNKLMIYDLNRVQEDTSRRKIVPVPDGENFSEITLHKIFIGGNPLDPNDMKLYPGSVLINVPMPKMHNSDMITNSIKNLGIALYPMKSACTNDPNDTNWLYASPNDKYPNTRAKLPHSPWLLKINDKTHLPVINRYGKYISKKTAGISGTQCDLLKALQYEKTLMIHISDNINITNITSSNGSAAEPIPEGFIWASLDCVALDTFCANYCFKMIPLSAVKEIKKCHNIKTEFIQEVPLAVLKCQNIITDTSIDSPLPRYLLYKDAATRGIGSQLYHVTGLNLTSRSRMASYHGHLIEEDNHNNWHELITKTLYYNSLTLLYNLQTTVLSYAKACDTLVHSHLYKDLMMMFDENHDGIIDYNEQGRGFETAQLEVFAYCTNFYIYDEYASLKLPYVQNITLLRNSNSNWNSEGQDFMKENMFMSKFSLAFTLSKQPSIQRDLFYDNMVYGNGYWPSFKTAEYIYYMTYVYGGTSLDTITLSSPYGCIFQYCDITKNGGHYTQNPDTALSDYFNDLKHGAKPLPFTFFVPCGFKSFASETIPNTIETNDPNLIFTTDFVEIW